MNNTETEIRFSDLYAMLLKSYKTIVCVVLVFAILGGCFGVYKGLNAAKSAAVTEEDVEKAEKAVKTAQTKVTNAEKALDKLLNVTIPDAERKIQVAEKQVQRRQEYIDKSLYYKLDPYNSGVSRLIFYIDTDKEINPAMPWMDVDPQKSIVTAYSKSFSADTEILDEIRSIMKTDADASYIYELISVSNISNQFVEIRVRNENAEIAEKVVDYLYEKLLERLKGSVGEFSANIISKFTGYEVDWDMNDKHFTSEDNLLTAERNLQDAYDSLQTLNESIPDKEQAIEDANEALEESNENLEEVRQEFESTEVSLKNIIKKTVIYAVASLFFGFVCISAVILFSGITGNKLQNQSQVVSRYSPPLLGILPVEKKRKFEKTIRKLEGDPETDYESAVRVAAQNILSVTGNKKVCLVSSLGRQVPENIASYLDDRFTVCGDILRDSGAVKALSDFDGVVLIEERGKSRIDQIDSEMLHAKALGKEVLGFILA